MLALILLSTLCYSQNNSNYEKQWEGFNKGFKYDRSNNYRGPKSDYIYPGQLGENNAKKSYQYPPQVSQKQIVYSRKKRYKNGTNNGVKQNIKKNEGQKLDDIQAPESEGPKINYPDWDGPNWDMEDGTVFKFILILIIIVLMAFLIYHFLFKSKVKTEKKINPIDYHNEVDINPEKIEEEQLFTELEKAISNNDFRLAVRIYYILLLKKLIEHEWIKWAKRKTNTHYLIEMSGHKSYERFGRAVRIFEWSWYGKNNPSQAEYKQFSQFFDGFLGQLKERNK